MKTRVPIDRGVVVIWQCNRCPIPHVVAAFASPDTAREFVETMVRPEQREACQLVEATGELEFDVEVVEVRAGVVSKGGST